MNPVNVEIYIPERYSPTRQTISVCTEMPARFYPGDGIHPEQFLRFGNQNTNAEMVEGFDRIQEWQVGSCAWWLDEKTKQIWQLVYLEPYKSSQ